jgi:hypothetical protein
MTQTTHPLRAIPRPKRILSCYSLVVVDRDGRPHLPLTRIYYEIQQAFSECPGCGAGVCARLPSIPDPMQAARLSRPLFAAAYEACIAHTAMGVGETNPFAMPNSPREANRARLLGNGYFPLAPKRQRKRMASMPEAGARERKQEE